MFTELSKSKEDYCGTVDTKTGLDVQEIIRVEVSTWDNREQAGEGRENLRTATFRCRSDSREGGQEGRKGKNILRLHLFRKASRWVKITH